MIKKIGKAFLRIEYACAAFLHVLKAGGINTIKVSQVQKDDALSGKNIVITGGSSGIGLAIAKEIIELHDGTIKANSQNEYTTFIIRLPRKKEEQ